MTARLVLPDALGTDTTERGAWRKTNNAQKLARVLWRFKDAEGISGPELFGALVENVIAAIQGSTAPSDWRRCGDAVSGEILRRMSVR